MEGIRCDKPWVYLHTTHMVLLPQLLLLLTLHIGWSKSVCSRGWFRSTDLWVMGPARFLCATLLKADRNQIDTYHYITIIILSNNFRRRVSHKCKWPKCRAFVAQWLEHWSCKPGVESSNLSEGFCPMSVYYVAFRFLTQSVEHQTLNLRVVGYLEEMGLS